MATLKETYKLPKAFKTKWIKALRSGKYKQGRLRLYNPKEDTYCCLGVAGKICGVDRLNINQYLDYLEDNKNLPNAIKGDCKN